MGVLREFLGSHRAFIVGGEADFVLDPPIDGDPDFTGIDQIKLNEELEQVRTGILAGAHQHAAALRARRIEAGSGQ